MTLGPRRVYANVGLPGSGLSYRTRLDSPIPAPKRVTEPGLAWAEPPRSGFRAPIHTPGVTAIPGTEFEIKSADVGVLTSPGLGELKQLINEATVRHSELRDQLAKRKNALGRAAGRLRWAQSLVVRLFTEKSIPGLVDAANRANEELEDTQAHLEGCFVEVDFAFDDATRDSYAALVRSFEELRSAQRIWDITATAAVDRVTQRTTAYSALTRVLVGFNFARSEIIQSQYRAMSLGNVAGRDLQIFPGFVMMREASRDFGLIELAQLECQLAHSNFIEEETVPSDAEQVGATWKRANKDGSRDRRFNDNYQIPIMLYGALAFSSQTGLAEVYQISSYAKAAVFAQAFAAHKRALANLNSLSTDALALPAPSDEADTVDDESEQPPVFVAALRKNLVFDWIVLALIIVGLALGSVWTADYLNRPNVVPEPTPSVKTVPPPAALARRHKGRRRHHFRVAPSSDAPAASDIAGPGVER